MTNEQQAILNEYEQVLAAERGLLLPPFIENNGILYIQHGEALILVAPDGKVSIPKLGIIDDVIPKEVQKQSDEIRVELARNRQVHEA
jgi:hypothetical protein